MFGRLLGPTRILLAGALALALLPATAAAAPIHLQSKNWGGYAVKSKSGGHFKKVSGRWTVRKPNCATRSPAYSSVWVGLGGFSASADRLEQAGTDANCSATGKPHYDAWYEITPAPTRSAALAVHPGDVIGAQVTVQGTSVTFRIHNRTTGGTFTKTVSTSSPDLSTAEWIVEAPQNCDPDGSNCVVEPLADFRTIAFSHAAATTPCCSPRTISNPAFTAYRLRLRTAANGDGGDPTPLSAGGSAFSIAYQRQVGAAARDAMAFPGAAH